MNYKIKIKNYSLIIKKEMVLNDVNFNIPDKKIISIIGPENGGKSALAKSLNRVIEINKKVKYKGDILFNEESIFNIDVYYLRRKIAFISKESVLFPHLNIFDNIIAGYKLKGIKTDKNLIMFEIEKILKLLGLWNSIKNIINNNIKILDEFDQLKVIIARAILLKPEVLIFDDCFRDLSGFQRNFIKDIMFDLKEDYSIVHIANDPMFAADFSDYTALIHSGKLIEYNSTEKILTRPDKINTEKYLIGEY